MKKLFLILFMTICSYGYSQEMEFSYENKWVDMGIWQIPEGADTTQLKSEWRSFFINDAVVRNYFNLYPEKEIKELVVNDSTTWVNRNKYRWMVYENLSRQVQVLVRERVRKIKKPSKAEINEGIQYKKIIQLLKNGYKPYQITRYVDSVYYGIDIPI